MSARASLRCERCGGLTDVDLKAVTVHDEAMQVSFGFRCSHCSFERGYIRQSVTELGALLVHEDSEGELARLTGLSTDYLKSYVYPPDVMKEVDLERRKIFDSGIKQQLKAGRQSYPIESQGWWRVYHVPTKNCEVWFHRSTKQYRLQVAGTEPVACANVEALGAAYGNLP